MATKVKMLKLLQESQGLLHLAERRPTPRTPTPLVLQYTFSRRKPGDARRKRILRINMQEPADIPYVVKITQLGGQPLGPQPPA